MRVGGGEEADPGKHRQRHLGEGRDPRDDFAQLRKEVSLYQKELGERPYQIVANKMDLPDAVENLKKFEKKIRRKAIPIAGDKPEGLDELKALLKKELVSA